MIIVQSTTWACSRSFPQRNFSCLFIHLSSAVSYYSKKELVQNITLFTIFILLSRALQYVSILFLPKWHSAKSILPWRICNRALSHPAINIIRMYSGQIPPSLSCHTSIPTPLVIANFLKPCFLSLP